MDYDVEIITPEIAAQYLGKNTINRNLSTSTIDGYAEAMRNGEWRMNGEAIKLSQDDTLLDGQHRLEAIIKSGIAQKFLVIRGLSKEDIKTIDIGKRRTAGDILSIEGLKAGNQNVLAAMCGYLMDFNDNEYKRYGGSMGVRRKTPTAVLSFAKNNRGVIKTCEEVTAYQKKIYPITSVSIVAACHYMFTQINPAKATMFLHGLVHGDSLQQGSPVLALRNRLILDQQAGKKGGENRRKYMALIVKAWKLFMDDEEVSGDFRYHADQPIILEWNKKISKAA